MQAVWQRFEAFRQYLQVHDNTLRDAGALTRLLDFKMEEQPVAGTQVPSQDGMYGSRKSRQQKVESKGALAHEDRRVKELTEGILYDFLPAALNVMLPRCEDPLQELDADRCRAVASAALAVSALMNAPPGFLEFLLCVPWRKLSQLYPKPDSIDKLVAKLQVTDEERRKLVNTRVEAALMPTVLDFLYKEKHTESVPPILQLTRVSPMQPDDNSAPVVVRETVAAVLDGATPLHCAALRGNPAQVDHLLYCGADPSLRTAAGELPIELVPVCGDRTPGGAPGQRSCRCMAPMDQEVWECRSRLARSLIARRCFFSFGVGLFSWLRLVFFCLLCLLGQAGRHTSISRPVVERHIDTRRQQKVAVARARAHNLVTRMRSEAEAGHRHLEQAKRDCRASAAFQRGPPDMSLLCFTDPNKSPPPPPPQFNQIHDINVHLQESGTSSSGEELPSEKAFKCFVRSVHALQSLDLHGDTVPQVFAELVAAGGGESRETHVLEDEQADLYSCWAESVLLKFRGCTCPGCAALAIQAVRMAHMQTTRLFGKVDCLRQSHPDRWRAVGQALVRVVYVHICLLLETEAQASATRSLVWRAEQCLREWDRLDKAGLTAGAGVLDPRHVTALQRWAKTADSDLYLAEALHGQGLPPTKTLQEVVQGAVSYGPDGAPILARPVSPEVVAALEQALTLASLPSPLLAHIVREVVTNAVSELAAGARLRELVGSKGAGAPGGGGGGTADAVMALTEALRAAESYKARLAAEMAAAMELRSKWMQRAAAVEKLEGAVEDVRSYIAGHPLSFTATVAAGSGGSTAGGSSALSSTAAAGPSPRGGGGSVATPTSGPGGGQDRSAAAVTSSSDTVAPGGPGTTSSTAEAGAAAAASGGGGGNEGASSSGGGSRGGDGPQQAPDLAEWDRRIKQLEAAMNEAKDANVSVTKAKRLLKEMATVAAAAEASRQLESVMARRPSGPLQLKLALNKAEAAATALASLGGTPVPGLADVLGPLIAAARRRLDSERAAEALSKAAGSFRTLADLGRLEAAIYNAKKIGAEELDPESYRTSLELRAHLQEAARGRAALETALRNLQNQLRPEDAEALERALQDATRWEDLLAPDTAKARKALEQWRAMTICEAKLSRLLRGGASTGVLARAIQEAAASGVKVQHAKRVLKILQGLEGVLASAADGGGGGGAAEELHGVVRTKLEAAEAAGVTTGPVPDAARRTLSRLAALMAREALEAALKPHADWPVAQRISTLKEALEKAEGVLGPQEVAAAAGGGGGEGGKVRGGEGGQVGHTRQQQSQQQPAKLANSSAAGRTSKGKRSSGGSSNMEAAAAAAAAAVSTCRVDDDAAAVAQSAANGCAGGASDAGSITGTGSNSSGSCSPTSSSNDSNATETAASAAAGQGPSCLDDDVLHGVRALVRKARAVLEADQAELIRLERERQEAERARKEAQERERQERLRQEQERQKREKAEAAERERALAEKRERARGDKTRQHQSKGKAAVTAAAAAATATPAGTAEKTPAAATTAGSAGAAGGGGGGGKGSGGRQGGGGKAAGHAAGVSFTPANAAIAAASGGAGPTAGSSRATTSGTGGSGGPSSGQSSSRKSDPSRDTAVNAPALADAPAAVAASAAPLAADPPAVLPHGPAVKATDRAPSGAVPSGGQSLASPSPSYTSYDGSMAGTADCLGFCAAADGTGATTAVPEALASVAPFVPSATAVVHMRGDSLESLGEVVVKLNREVIEALDMDSDCAVHEYGRAFVVCNDGGGGDGSVPGLLGFGGGAAGIGAAATSGLSDHAFYVDGVSGTGGAISGGDGVPSFGTHGSGGGSFGRCGSGPAATADSVLDQTPSQRTSSVMSSLASADDVMLPVAGGGTGLGMGNVTSGGGSGGIGSSTCISVCSAQASCGGGDGSSGETVPPPSLPLSATTTCTSIVPSSAEAAAAPNGASSGGGGGVSAAGKPRFGFVDLGGASWGLDSPLLTVARGAALFPSLQSSMADFGAGLGGGKPTDVPAGAAGGSTAGGGWPIGHSYGATAAAYGMFPSAQAAGQQTVNGACGVEDSLGPARHQQHQQQYASVQGSGGLPSQPTGLGGAAVGFGLGGLTVRAPGHEGAVSGGLPLGTGMASLLTSPRTTVATTSPGMHGLLQVRPLSTTAGTATGSGTDSAQFAGLGALQPGAVAGGRHSLNLQLQLPASSAGPAGGVGPGGGLLLRSGFWTPPSFQQGLAGGEMSPEGAGAGGAGGGMHGVQGTGGMTVGAGMHAHLAMGLAGGVADWQARAPPSPQHHQVEGLQLLSSRGGALGSAGGGPAGGAAGQLRAAPGGGGPLNAASVSAAAASRICRFYLQGFCRDGERCRFAHVSPSLVAGAAAMTAGGGCGTAAATPAQFLQLAAAAGGAAAATAAHVQFARTSAGGPFTGQSGAVGSGGGGAGGGSVRPVHVGHGSAVGSFAFGAPGAEAFAPLGSTSLGRNAACLSPVMGGNGEPLTAEQLLSRASAPQLRHHGGLAGGAAGGNASMDRSQLSAQSAPAAAATYPGSGVSGGKGLVLGQNQQAVQLRDSATGATYSAVLTVSGASSAHSPTRHMTPQAPHQVVLPDDLTFSPPSSSSSMSVGGIGGGQTGRGK